MLKALNPAAIKRAATDAPIRRLPIAMRRDQRTATASDEQASPVGAII
jgi:hypothetical protein